MRITEIHSFCAISWISQMIFFSILFTNIFMYHSGHSKCNCLGDKWGGSQSFRSCWRIFTESIVRFRRFFFKVFFWGIFYNVHSMFVYSEHIQLSCVLGNIGRHIKNDLDTKQSMLNACVCVFFAEFQHCQFCCKILWISSCSPHAIQLHTICVCVFMELSVNAKHLQWWFMACVRNDWMKFFGGVKVDVK